MLGALLVTFLFVGYAHSYKVNYLIGESEEVEDFDGEETTDPSEPSSTTPSEPTSTTPSGAVAIMASSLFTSAIAYIIL